MSQALPTGFAPTRSPTRASVSVSAWEVWESTSKVRRLRALLSLFALYAGSLLAVMTLSDGADIGCVLVAIAGHVLYATWGLLSVWRDSSWLERARLRSRTTLRERHAI
ncbi:hypothetical protein AKJ09_04800 [Labilithrix luteola]|uniref:Uncharacterized protein n=1 Tax=Labilithrix luteola TaxID=1391654 RepID=A0A0K1PXL4_9BACT|nr:hypothetical protein [Labilithrix luteola]AKU98136.1 hypothetical protein AKJ09_04800 [Labilithrix luteola]